MLLVPMILAVRPLPRFLCDIVEMFTSFCFSSPNVTVIDALFSLIARTPLGLPMFTLNDLELLVPSPATLIVTGTLVILLIVSWST